MNTSTPPMQSRAAALRNARDELARSRARQEVDSAGSATDRADSLPAVADVNAATAAADHQAEEMRYREHLAHRDLERLFAGGELPNLSG